MAEVLAVLGLVPAGLHYVKNVWSTTAELIDISAEIELFCITAHQVKHDLDYAKNRYSELSDLVHQDQRLQHWIYQTIPRITKTLDDFEKLLPKRKEGAKHINIKDKVDYKWTEYNMVKNLEGTLRVQHASLLAGINMMNNLALYSQATQARDRANGQTDHRV